MSGRARLLPDRRLRTEANGRVLLGGHPFRVLRLSVSGAETVKTWFAAAGGSAVDEANDDTAAELTPTEIALRERLVQGGLAHPLPEPARRTCHVVIPFRGHPDELAATLRSVIPLDPVSITVVDDGNPAPVPSDEAITVLHHEQQRGPAAARNTGWEHLRSSHSVGSDDLVVFVDAGVVAEDGLLEGLGGHFADPSVGAAAPRVTTAAGTSAIDRYESLHSPLDLGIDPSAVGPDKPVTYVPTACLAVRASVLAEIGGFDESLRFGEDVDLVWRLSRVASVRYDPSMLVHHPARSTLPRFAVQRMDYASAAASLSARHPEAAQTWRTNVLGLAGVAITWAGHPVVGGAIGLLPVRKLAEQLATTATPVPTAIRLLALGQGWALRSFAENMARSWFVPAALLATCSPLGRPARRWILAGWARRVTTTTDPTLLAIGVIDDVAYGCGVIRGAWRQRSLRVLMPEVRRW